MVMQPDRREFLAAGGAAVMGLTSTPASADEATDRAAKEFIESHVKTMRPLEIAGGIAWWNANTTGKDDDFK
jgi:peptidyl-dipeptidase A